MGILRATLTQGSNDAFVQVEMDTGLAGQTRRAFRIGQIELEFPTTIAGSNALWEVALSRRSKAAMPNVSDLDVIRKFKQKNSLITSGAIVVPAIDVWVPQAEVLVVEDTMYWQLDTDQTSATNVVQARVLYDLVEISEIDRLTLLTQSLQ